MPKEEGRQPPQAGHLEPHQAGHHGHPHPQHPDPHHPAAVHHHHGQHQAPGHHQSYPQLAPGCGCPQSHSCHPLLGGQDVAAQGAHAHVVHGHGVYVSQHVLEQQLALHVRLHVHEMLLKKLPSLHGRVSLLSEPWVQLLVRTQT